MRVADSTCAEDKHVELSCAEHCRTFGSNAHAPGFSSTPSATPSLASHAARTAWWIIGYLDAGIALAGVTFIERLIATRPAWRCRKFTAGAPAMIPSKSAGYRAASVTPCRPP